MQREKKGKKKKKEVIYSERNQEHLKIPQGMIFSFFKRSGILFLKRFFSYINMGSRLIPCNNNNNNNLIISVNKKK